MAILVPCIRGRMGETDYYLARMTARELVQGVRHAKSMDKWATMGIEERMQREPNEKRIENEIAPYIANSKDRFFGSVIVLVYEGDISFESLVNDFKAKLPKAYESQSEDIGFITIDGGQLIMLDGQHRLLALEKVIKRDVTGEYMADVPNDHISVVFIKHEGNEKTRRIFNKVNRYAKSTNRSDNIITSEDDGYAIVTRLLLEDHAPLGMSDNKGESIVNWKSNTLAARSKQLTTISAVYEIVRMILDQGGIAHFDEKHRITRPTDDELSAAYEHAEQWWRAVLEGLQPYQEALKNLADIPKMREDTSEYSLLFKPAAQVTLFQGLVLAVERGLTIDQAVERANDLPWSMSDPLWTHIIVNTNGTINAYAEARDRTAETIAYLIGYDVMSTEQVEKFRRIYNKAKGYDFDNPPKDENISPFKLPEPVSAARGK